MGASIKIRKFFDCSTEHEHSRMMRLILAGKEAPSKRLSHVDHAFYHADGHCPIHIHEHSEEIFLFTRGSGVFHLDGKEIPYKAGDVFCVPKGVPHGLRCGSDDATEHVVCCVNV